MAQMPQKKINLRNEVFLTHPVSSELKEAFNRNGMKVLDIAFAPEDYEHSAKAASIISDNATEADAEAEDYDPEVLANGENGARTEAIRASRTRGPVRDDSGPTPAVPHDSVTSSQQMLMSSGELRAQYDIGGRIVLASEIVNAAFKSSGLTDVQWNTLDQEERDKLLLAEVDIWHDAQKRTDDSRKGSQGTDTLNGANGDDKTADSDKKPEDMTDAELREAVEKKTGEKPAWNTGREKLIEKLNA
jgi:hypothetical protein